MIKQIFDKEPGRWGLRGDPSLWQELRAYILQTEEPATEAEFIAVLHMAFESLTGELLVPGKEIFVQKFSHGGRSSRFISTDFWLDEAFPILQERFKRFKKA